MDFGYARGYRMQQDADPLALITAKPATDRSWRMQQTLLSWEQSEASMSKVSKSDQRSRLEGLALAMKSRVSSVGYGAAPAELPPKMTSVIMELRSDPQNFIRQPVGNGRERVACAMRPGDYVLLQAAEALGLWYNYKLYERTNDWPDTTQPQFASDVSERLHITLMRLSGNMAATVRDAQGRMSQAANSSGVTMMPVGDGETAPADVVMATQLLSSFGLHPKEMAWVLNELVYDMAKGRGSSERHAPSLAAMQRAANALVVLASDPAAMPQHPNTDLTAAARAAVHSTLAELTTTNSSSSSATTRLAGDSLLPPPGTISDDMLVQTLRGQSVSSLRTWLERHSVPHRHCLEKDDMVQMILQTHKSGAVARAAAAPKAAKIPDRPPPCDLSRWRHMALFLKAEAGEAAEGRSPAVTAAFKAAVEAARENDDELYGCLCAWNAVKAIVDGSSSWVVGDVIQLLDYAAAAEIKCKAWKGYELMIQPRIKVLKKPLRDKIQRQVAEARSSSSQQRKAASSSPSSTFKFSDIRSSKVRELLQDGDIDLIVKPKSGVATIHSGVVYGGVPLARKCAGCQHDFDSLLRCSRCNSVEYCSKECQKVHWKAQHRRDCDRLKTERLAAR